MLHNEVDMKTKITFSTYNELYVVDCYNVMYLEADYHYTHVYYLTGAHFLIPFGLSEVMETITHALGDDCFLLRLGRKYVVNTHVVFHINTVKQVLLLTDMQGNSHSLHLPKTTLRSLIDLIDSKNKHL